MVKDSPTHYCVRSCYSIFSLIPTHYPSALPAKNYTAMKKLNQGTDTTKK